MTLHFDNQPPKPISIEQAWNGFRKRIEQHGINQQVAQQLADLGGWLLELDDCIQAQVRQTEAILAYLGLPTACSTPKRGFEFLPREGGAFRVVPREGFEPAPDPIDGPRDYGMGSEDESC